MTNANFSSLSPLNFDSRLPEFEPLWRYLQGAEAELHALTETVQRLQDNRTCLLRLLNDLERSPANDHPYLITLLKATFQRLQTDLSTLANICSHLPHPKAPAAPPASLIGMMSGPTDFATRSEEILHSKLLS